jgi:two-component system, OmpR family, phosphate regulon sensor histidine kinase PhoR
MSFVAWAIRAPLWMRSLLVAGLLLLTIPVGWASIALSPPGAPLAAWWPAAALAVVAATVARGSQRLAVAAGIVMVSVVANLAADRPLLVSLGFGVANAIEAVVVAAIATSRDREVSIDRVGDAERLFLGVLAGAVALGLGVALVVLLDGGDPISAGLGAATSHGSAVLLLAPLAILPATSFRTERKAELLVQLVLLISVAAMISSPGQTLPLSFLVFPLILWGTFRFGTGIMAIETLLIAVVTTGALYFGGGPYFPVYQDNPAISVHLVQIFVVVVAVTVLVLGRVRAERHRVNAISRAREVVLLSGITGSSVGFVILERESGADLRVAASNELAELLLHTRTPSWRIGDHVTLEQFPQELVEPLTDVIEGADWTWDGLITAADGERIVDAHLRRVRSARGTVVLTVQAEDVTLREQARLANERALENERATVEQLRETNRQQDDFVSAVSHELRTPLTSIIGFTDELTQLDLPDEAKTYLDVVTRNAVRLGELVEDLLEVGRLNSQVQLKASERLDIDSVIDAVISDLHHAAAARSITVERTGATGERIHSVRTDVTRILVNLVSNAIKFSPVGGRVEITVEVHAAQLQIRVIDSGSGISKADLDRVFERFYRTTSAATIPGSGLGLVISRGLAESLGGAVELRSVEGEGTTAVLTLPRALKL